MYRDTPVRASQLCPWAQHVALGRMEPEKKPILGLKPLFPPLPFEDNNNYRVVTIQ